MDAVGRFADGRRSRWDRVGVPVGVLRRLSPSQVPAVLWASECTSGGRGWVSNSMIAELARVGRDTVREGLAVAFVVVDSSSVGGRSGTLLGGWRWAEDDNRDWWSYVPARFLSVGLAPGAVAVAAAWFALARADGTLNLAMTPRMPGACRLRLAEWAGYHPTSRDSTTVKKALAQWEAAGFYVREGPPGSPLGRVVTARVERRADVARRERVALAGEVKRRTTPSLLGRPRKNIDVGKPTLTEGVFDASGCSSAPAQEKDLTGERELSGGQGQISEAAKEWVVKEATNPGHALRALDVAERLGYTNPIGYALTVASCGQSPAGERCGSNHSGSCGEAGVREFCLLYPRSGDPRLAPELTALVNRASIRQHWPGPWSRAATDCLTRPPGVVCGRGHVGPCGAAGVTRLKSVSGSGVSVSRGWPSGPPRRVDASRWEELTARLEAEGWAGASRLELVVLARRGGWWATVEAALEVDWRNRMFACLTNPAAYTAALARCLACRCDGRHPHSPRLRAGDEPCGPQVARRWRTRRLEHPAPDTRPSRRRRLRIPPVWGAPCPALVDLLDADSPLRPVVVEAVRSWAGGEDMSTAHLHWRLAPGRTGCRCATAPTSGVDWWTSLRTVLASADPSRAGRLVDAALDGTELPHDTARWYLTAPPLPPPVVGADPERLRAVCPSVAHTVGSAPGGWAPTVEAALAVAISPDSAGGPDAPVAALVEVLAGWGMDPAVARAELEDGGFRDGGRWPRHPRLAVALWQTETGIGAATEGPVPHPGLGAAGEVLFADVAALQADTDVDTPAAAGDWLRDHTIPTVPTRTVPMRRIGEAHDHNSPTVRPRPSGGDALQSGRRGVGRRRGAAVEGSRRRGVRPAPGRRLLRAGASDRLWGDA